MEKQRRLFRTGREYRQVHLDWLEDYTPSAMAEAFKISGDRVVDACQGDTTHPDQFFYPAAFLYRHYLELEFKNIIAAGTKLDPAPPCETQGWGHDLSKLWKDARLVITTVFPGDDPTALIPLDEAVAEMSEIDPDGQGFRYYTDRKGCRNLEKSPRIVSLTNLRNQMNELFEFLVGCSLGIDHAIEQQEYSDDQ